MSDEVTPYLGLIKPEVGASDDTWGDKTNHNWDLVDAAIFAIPPPGSGGGGGTILISDTPPPIVTTPVGSLWYESDTGSMYILYDDGTSKQWVFVAGGGFTVFPNNAVPVMDGTGAAGTSTYYARGDHVHPSDTSRASTSYVDTQDATKLSKSSNLSDVTNVVTARQNVYAAPFDALAYSGMQINGSMEVSQELGTTGTNVSGKYPADGWSLGNNSAAVVNASQGVSTFFPGFKNNLSIGVGTALGSLAVPDTISIGQVIEGYRIIRLAWGTANAQPLTIGFWTWHTVTGLYSVSLRATGGGRSYVATYNQIANAPQYNVVTIPGCTDGTWNIDNTIGIILTFSLACGTQFTAPAANTWSSGNYVAAPGQVNAVASTSNFFRLTGVVVLPGIEAPSAARSPLIMRPYDQELVTCQRYYEKSYDYANVPGSTISTNGCAYYIGVGTTVGAALSVDAFFKTRKRSSPTMIWYSTATGVSGKIRQSGLASDINAVSIMVGDTAAKAYGVLTGTENQVLAHWVADARL